MIPVLVLAGLALGAGFGGRRGMRVAVPGALVLSVVWGIAIGLDRDVSTGAGAMLVAAANAGVGLVVGVPIGRVTRRRREPAA